MAPPSRRFLVVSAAVFLGSSLGMGAARASAEEVHVLAAASLSDALQAIAAPWQAATGNTIVLNLGASNDLARQIRAGAPADVFFSADEAQMDGLQRDGLVRAADRVDLLSNTLVVVVPVAGSRRISAPADLASVKRLALADPQAVPAGVYARRWLESLGLWARVEGQVIPTLNVRAALSAVESENAEAGIVYKTDAADLEAGEGRLRGAARRGAGHRVPSRPSGDLQPARGGGVRAAPPVRLGQGDLRSLRVPGPRRPVGPAVRGRAAGRRLHPRQRGCGHPADRAPRHRRRPGSRALPGARARARSRPCWPCPSCCRRPRWGCCFSRC